MGIGKEPLNIDFVVENRPLTKDEEKQISEYIATQKKKRAQRSKAITRVTETKAKIQKHSCQQRFYAFAKFVQAAARSLLTSCEF